MAGDHYIPFGPVGNGNFYQPATPTGYVPPVTSKFSDFFNTRDNSQLTASTNQNVFGYNAGVVICTATPIVEYLRAQGKDWCVAHLLNGKCLDYCEEDPNNDVWAISSVFSQADGGISPGDGATGYGYYCLDESSSVVVPTVPVTSNVLTLDFPQVTGIAAGPINTTPVFIAAWGYPSARSGSGTVATDFGRVDNYNTDQVPPASGIHWQVISTNSVGGKTLQGNDPTETGAVVFHMSTPFYGTTGPFSFATFSVTHKSLTTIKDAVGLINFLFPA